MSASKTARNACMDSAGRHIHQHGSLEKLAALLRHGALLLALTLLALAHATTASADDIDYVYDEAGRLVQATNNTSGESVRYTYDAVGNITSQISGPVTTLAIGHFSPRRGPVGTQVTINGTGFSTTPASNTVRFNGVAATVVSATQTKIVAAVPVSASSGPVSVEVASTTVTSAESFVVTAAGDGPSISVVLPNVSRAGNIVTVVGANFEPVPTQNRVRFNNATAEMLAATETVLTVRVPLDAGSGKIKITTPRGIAVSPTDFIVIPTGIDVTDLAGVGRVETDGTTNAVSLASTSTYVMRMFEGKVGDLLTVGLSDMTFTAVTVTVRAPDNTVIATRSVTPAVPGLQLPKLTVAGTYSVYVTPGSVGSANLAIFRPSTASLVLNTPVPVTITPPGRRALLTFTVPANSYADVALSGVTLSAGTLTLMAPGGSVVTSKTFTSTGLSFQPLLKQAGQYSLLIDPTGSVGGSLTVNVNTSATPTLGPSHEVSVNSAEPTVLTFRAEANEYLSLLTRISAPANGFQVGLVVKGPDGAVVAQRNVGTSYTVSGARIGSGVLNFGPVDMAGTYTLTVQRAAGASATVTLNLTHANEMALSLAKDVEMNGAVESGQTLITRFSASAGEFRSIAVTERDGAMRGATATVIKPDGTVFASQTFTIETGPGSMGTIPGGGSGDPYRDGTAVVNLGPFPMAGTYRVVFQQSDHGREQDTYSGSWLLTLSEPVKKSIDVDGPLDHARFEINGQGVLYSFTGAAGQLLALGMRTDLSEPSNPNTINAMAIGVFDPDGNQISAGAVTVVPYSGEGSIVGGFGSGVVNIGPLPASGTDKIFVQNLGYWRTSTGGIESYLSTPLTSANGEMETMRMGQGALVTFNASAGDHRGIRVDTSGDIPSSRLRIFSPDGSQLGATTNLTQETEHIGYRMVNLGPLPAAGTYKAIIEQTSVHSPSIGTFKFLVTSPVTGTLSGNANIDDVPLLAGQPLRYTFSATQGSFRSLVVRAVNSPIKTASVVIQDPTGATVESGSLNATGSPLYSGRMLLNVGPLPVTGEYSLLIKQTARNRLDPLDPPGLGFTLAAPVESSSQTISVGLQGQAALRTFAGTAGQVVAMQVAEDNTSITNTSIKLIDPNGSVSRSGVMTATRCGGCTGYSGTATVAGGVLPASGTYGVLVQQTSIAAGASGTGALDIVVAGSGATAGSTSNIATTTAGQYAISTHTVAAGESFSVALTSTAQVPASATGYSIYVMRPNGTSEGAIGCSTANPGCELAIRDVPTAGTYQIQVRPASGATISGVLTIAPAVAGNLAVDTPMPVSLAAIGQTAHLGFSTTTTQTLALTIDSATTVPANTNLVMTIYNSAGGAFNDVTFPAGSTLNLSNLAPDNYSVLIRPVFPATSDLQLTLRSGLGGVAPNDGTSINFSGSVPGQRVYYTFTAQAGDSVGVALTNLVVTPSTSGHKATIYVYAPDSSNFLDSALCAQTNPDRCGISLRNLAKSGTYRVVVAPYLVTTAVSGTLTVSKAVTGTLSADQPVTVNLPVPGQPALYNFTTTVGQHVSVNLGNVSTAPAGTAWDLVVYNSQGVQVAAYTTATGDSWSLANLPADNYAVWITQALPSTGSAQLTLRSTPMLVADGTSTPVSTTEIGQSAYYTFEAQQGESIGVALSNIVLSPATTGHRAYVNVYAPNGTNALHSELCVSTADRCGVSLRNLAVSGTYRVVVVPYLGSRTITGTLTISRAVTGTLAPDQPVALNLAAPGQPALYSFTAMAGQHFSLNIGGLTAAPAGSTVSVTVYDSLGNQEATKSISSGATFEFPAMVADTYFVWITQPLPFTGSMQVALRSTEALPTDGTGVNFSTGSTGQVAYYTLDAQAGESVSLAVTNIVTTPTNTGQILRVYLYAPGSGTASSSPVCYVAGCMLSVRNLTQTGKYRVALVPLSGVTLTGTLSVTKSVTGTLTPDQPATLNMNAPGQSAHYSFTATAGQTFSLNLGPRSTTPANAEVSVAVFNSANTQIASGSTTTGLSFQLQNLAAGTYYAWVTQESPTTGSMQVRLGTMPLLPTDGTPTNFDTAPDGQSAYYTFNAQAGDSIAVAVTDIVATPAATNQLLWVSVFAPGSTSVLVSLNCTAVNCVIPRRNLAMSGTYRVVLTPSQAGKTVVGKVSVSMAATASLSAGTPLSLSLTQPGQPAVLSFSRATAQPLSLVIGSISSAPSGTIYNAFLYNSSNAQVATGASATSITLTLASLPAGSYTLWIYPAKPSTATMTVSF